MQGRHVLGLVLSVTSALEMLRHGSFFLRQQLGPDQDLVAPEVACQMLLTPSPGGYASFCSSLEKQEEEEGGGYPQGSLGGHSSPPLYSLSHFFYLVLLFLFQLREEQSLSAPKVMGVGAVPPLLQPQPDVSPYNPLLPPTKD